MQPYLWLIYFPKPKNNKSDYKRKVIELLYKIIFKQAKEKLTKMKTGYILFKSS